MREFKVPSLTIQLGNDCFSCGKSLLWMNLRDSILHHMQSHYHYARIHDGDGYIISVKQRVLR